MNPDLTLYLVTDSAQAEAGGWRLDDLVREAVAGGVTCIQVREKTGGARRFIHQVRDISAAVPPEVAILVNDRVDVYLAARDAGVRVTGVHLGQSDISPEAARRMIGPDAVIGLSASTPAQLAEAAASGARIAYVGIGALHATATKPDAPEPLGTERFRELVALSALPAVAIGGIGVTDMAPLRRAGAAGAAVVSAICRADNPRHAAADLRLAWDNADDAHNRSEDEK